VISHPRRTDYGKAQLIVLGLQKDDFLKLFPELLLGLLLSLLGTDRCVGQASGLLLSHLSSLVCLCKITLEKGDPPNKAL
jgi:hypothetical protein